MFKKSCSNIIFLIKNNTLFSLSIIYILSACVKFVVIAASLFNAFAHFCCVKLIASLSSTTQALLPLIFFMFHFDSKVLTWTNYPFTARWAPILENSKMDHTNTLRFVGQISIATKTNVVSNSSNDNIINNNRPSY